LKKKNGRGTKKPPTESPENGTVIDPEDGLFQGMAKLEEKLGQKGFLDRLYEAIPLRPRAK
jgi:hypothetical protein